MGYDLGIVWSHRVGASGDDLYNILGATKIDGSLHTGHPTFNYPGINSFSATPTIAEINAAELWNQAIGALNRRILTYNAAFGTSMTTQSYITGPRVTAAIVASIQSKINTLRTTEGAATFTFTTATAGQPIKGLFLAEIRKALSAATLTLNPVIAKGFIRNDTPFGTLVSEAYAGSPSIFIGKVNTSPFKRQRVLCSFRIPEWLTTCSAVNASVYRFSYNNTQANAGELWVSNTDDSAYSSTADAYNFDNLAANIDLTITTQQLLSVATGLITAMAGAHASFILSTDNERLATGATTTNDFSASGVTPYDANKPTVLTITF